MRKILTVEQANKASESLRYQGKRVVLAGGCFDILHVGHVRFLERAKESGDVLFVFLEADESIKQLKGEDRPINNQADRAIILSAIAAVDYVIKLSPGLTDNDYDRIVTSIKPDILAVTKGDLLKKHKERQAKLIGGKVVEVTDSVSNKSTSRIVNSI